MSIIRKVTVTAAFAGLIAALPAVSAHAQAQPAQAQPAWPQRAVKFILPFGAGSATDIAARLIGEKLSIKWGKPVIIENRPGADGLVAINAFTSAADDHVLLYASSASFMAHPYTQEKVPYDLYRDFAPIAQVSDTILSAGVPAATGYKTIGEFVAAAKKDPAKHNYAGAAGLPEFAAMAFVKSENLNITKIPYKDVVQAGRDLGENRIQFLLSSLAVVQPLLEAGKVRVVGVGVRTPLAPGVPTVTEAGYPALQIETTSAFYGPRGMPEALRARIGADVIAAVKDPTISERIGKSGQAVRPGGPDVLTETLKRQAARTAEIAKVLGMKPKN
jgi:tripartite-type tricarboxylate transporter receptor subunit TctC